MKTLVAGRSARQVRELIGAGRTLGSVTALIFEGPGDDLGADAVWRCDLPEFELSPVEVGLDGLQAACAELGPDLVLLGADSCGRDWAPRLAWRLGAGLVTDCVGWDEQLRFLRPVYGGKALAAIAVLTAIKVAVLRPGVFPPTAPAANPVRPLQVAAGQPRTRVVERRSEAAAGPSLQDASIVVSGGRGLGGPESFELLRELAAVLGAAVGASRAAVDAGWVPASWQIGQTGKSVRPDLYLAVGISGASQHMAGVGAAKHVVAVNTDADAPIFETARLGVVGDYREVLPALTAALREELAR